MTFDYRDSNTTYRAYGNDEVTISGGKNVSLSEFVVASDERIQDSVKDKVVKINLAEKGIPEPQICVMGHSAEEIEVEGEGTTSTVYANGERMTIARYPNDGYMTVGTVIAGKDKNENMSFTIAEDRADNWTNASDAWVFGFWYYDWSDQTAPVASIQGGTITTSIPSAFGVKGGQRFYIYNLLEELDAPGEWFYDKTTGDFYFYPPENCENVTLAFNNKNIINLENEADSMTFSGLNIENAAVNALRAVNSDYLTIKDCTVKNTAADGIVVTNGKNANIVENTVYNIGATGINASGGNITTLEGCGYKITENKVYDVAEITKRYAPNIRISGVGIEVSDNEIYNAPHSGIIFGGNDHVISDNEIYNVLTDSSDSGAIYSGRSHIARGTVIENNYIHDIKSGVLGEIYGVYLDDSMCGTTVTNNRFEDITGFGVFINGGRDNIVTDNDFTNITASGVRFSNAGMTDWYETDAEFIEAMGLNKGLHQTAPYAKYKNLSNILNDDYREPKYNIITGNTFLECSNNISVESFDGVTTVDYIKSINTIQQ